VRWRFAPLTAPAEQIRVAMAAACPVSHIRGFGRMIVAWEGVERLACPILSIHGDRDRIVPPYCAEPGLVIKGAGHAFTLTHPDQIKSAILDFLKAKVAA
jgi:pimeloyl-ACP methyl ester carboxylesterase